MSQHPQLNEILERARNIRLLVLDVDGVLTDGKLYFTNQGDEMKAFSTLDGHGIKQLQKHGIRVALITGRSSDIVKRRAAELGIELLLQGREDKLVALDEILQNLELGYTEVAYVGDDWPDLACIRRAGLGVTVPNAHPDVRQHAFFSTSIPGGAGAVREVCDWILQAQGYYEAALAGHL